MATVRYRTIKVITDNDEQMEDQINHSLATAVHTGTNIVIKAGPWIEDDPNPPQYFKELPETGVLGAITKEQLDNLKVRNIDA